MRKRIAMISEHASPLAVLGGVDSGGQNVYVAELAKYLSRINYDIDVFTRWEDASVQKVVSWMDNVRVIHVKAGPVKYVPKEDLLKHMPEFAKDMMQFMEEENLNYDLVHANFFMSALVAMELKEMMDIPYIVTYHALGKVRRIHQKALMKGDDKIVSGMKNKVMTAMSNVMPESMVAKQMDKMQKPRESED